MAHPALTTRFHSQAKTHQCCTDIVSAIGISAILAKNIDIGYWQYYKMYIGNQNFTFLWES